MRLKWKKLKLANGGSSSSVAESSSLKTTPSSLPSSNDDDGRGQQQHHQQGGKRSRLVWTPELHALFLKAYNSLGEEAVPRRILEKMNVPGVSRENIASHLQKHKLVLKRDEQQHKLNLRREKQLPLGVQAPTHSPTEEAPASHTLRSLPTNTPLAEVSQAHLELGQVLSKAPPDCLSRNNSSIAANLEMVQSIQQLCGPPIEVAETQPAETMQRAPADAASLEHNGNRCTEQRIGTWTAEFLVADEANTEAEIGMAQAENAAEPNTAPAAGIIEQYWESPDTEASISSRDLFGLPGGS